MEIDVADEALTEITSLKVQKVYEVESDGGIPEHDNWKAFGDNEDKKAGVMYIGDSFTPTYDATIDQKDAGDPCAKLKYKSGADEITLAADNQIYIVYTAALYSDVTFTTKLQGSGTAQAVEAITVTGTPAGEDAVNETVKTTVTLDSATGKIKLLPGHYEYSIPLTADYKAKTGSFDVAETGAATSVEVELEPNDQVLTSIEVDDSKLNTNIHVTSSAEGRSVGKLSVKELDADGTPMTGEKAKGVTWDVKDSGEQDAKEKVSIDTDGNVTIKSTAVAGTYTVTATSKDGTHSDVKGTYSLEIAEDGDEGIAAATDDFSGETSIFTKDGTPVTAGALAVGSAVMFNPTKYGNWGAHKALVVSNTTAKVENIGATVDDGEKLVITYREGNGYLINGGTNTVTIKNTAGTELVSYTYSSNYCNVNDVKFLGETVSEFKESGKYYNAEEKSLGFHAQSGYDNKGDANGWDAVKSGSENKAIKYTAEDKINPKVTITMEGQKIILNIASPETKAQDTLVSHEFTKDSIDGGTKVDLGSIEITSTINNAERSSGIYDLKTVRTKAGA